MGNLYVDSTRSSALKETKVEKIDNWNERNEMNEERNERSCKRKFSNNESVSVDKNSLKAVSYAVPVTTRLNEKTIHKM